MKNLFVIVILAFAACGVFAQAKKVKANEQLIISVGRQATTKIDKLKVRFLSVSEDSRCPTDTNCVWAGNAKIKIQVGKGKTAAKIFEINTSLDPQTISFAGYEIKLVDLDPKPASNIRIDRNGYTATLNVRRIR